jgi:hypothetical protein
MSDTDSTDCKYVVGEAPPQRADRAFYYTKPPVAGCTGGGYELWRSKEEQPGYPDGKKYDVYVSVHRLLAVVACYPDDYDIEVILDDLGEKDVHHESGIPWDNRPDGITVMEHGRHASLTNSEKRAYAEDAKRLRDGQATIDDSGGCSECGGDAEARINGSEYCLECATDAAAERDVTVEVI